MILYNYKKFMASTYNINSSMFNKHVNKFNDFEDIIKIPRYVKLVKVNNKYTKENKDGRYSYKNRRTINKDWKDFNNSQY